jgi:hypothetical protein
MAVTEFAGAPANPSSISGRISALSAAAIGSVVIAAGAIAVLIWRLPPLGIDVITGLFALAFVPAWITLIVFAARKADAPYYAVTPLTALALSGGALLVVNLAFRSTPVGALHAALLYGVSQIAPLLALFCALRAPHEGAKPVLPVVAIGGCGLVTLVGMAALAVFSTQAIPLSANAPLTCALYAIGLTPALIANWAQARREKRLPVEKSDKQPDHISGISAGGLVLFVLLILVLGIWAAEQGLTAQIDTLAGSIVIFGLAGAFLLLALLPFMPPSPMATGALKIVRLVLSPFGWLASWLDSLMVFPLAGTLGATQSKWERRYLLLLGNTVPCSLLGWYLPPPYGLVALIFALIGAIAIARRWAWIEEDRENAMLNRKFEGNHLRVGFGQDLRDETLVAFMTLLFLVPLALRQLYLMLGPDTFEIANAAVANDPLAWFTFFGTELAKALPFVDWAEVYHVEGNAAIHLDPERITPGNHVIFASRILVDLVLLAAFLQAISVANRTKKLKEMFENETLDQLDPFLEPGAFRKLVINGPNGFELNEAAVKQFPRYNEDRLEVLKQRGDKDELGFVARRLLERYAEGGPEDQILDQAKRAKPNREKCDELIDTLRMATLVRIGPLKAAHFNLNTKPDFWFVRQQIAELIARQTEEPAALNALSEILIGPGPGVADARQEVRYAALLGLYKPAVSGNQIARVSIARARGDNAARVREEAERICKEIGEA